MIRNYVASTAVSAGSKINEDELAQKLGISKSPVRDALSRLSLEGYVRILPNRGAFKVKLSAQDVSEIMLIREALEGLAIRIAAPNLTDKTIKKLRGILAELEELRAVENYLQYQKIHDSFYALIYGAAKSPRLARLIWSMYDQLRGLLSDYFRTPERVSKSMEGKLKLLDALEKGDLNLAESIRKDLVRATSTFLMKEVSLQQ
jgi:DNA-binding GntR family transcriptional regulator